MPRINPVVTQKAFDIVQKIPKMHKGEYVSDAIVEKSEREQGILLEARVEALERIVKEMAK